MAKTALQTKIDFLRSLPDSEREKVLAGLKPDQRRVIDQALKKPTERESQRDLMARKRKSERDIVVPDIKDPARRQQLEHDDAAWLKEYFGDVFFNPFTDDQLEIIESCGRCLEFGTKQAQAAPRGEGKSSIVKYLALKYALYRKLRFVLVIAATGPKADKTTASLKRRLASKAPTSSEIEEIARRGGSTKGLVPNTLAEDFPLECYVARHVNNWSSRARNVTANGQRPIHVHWGSSEGYFILPTWEEEEPLGPIIMSLSWSSDELQGCNVFDMRPEFVMIDDLDSRSSLAAEQGVVAGKIEEVIEKTVGGLGGQRGGLGQYMLCTITSEQAAAFKFTDQTIKPAWMGSRKRAIRTWPTNMKLWDRYVAMRQKGMATGDPFAREAHKFYVENREAMDLGAEVSNPYRFNGQLLGDGTPQEISNLQHCFNFIADSSMEAFNTEYQNDPPRHSALLETKLTPYHVFNCAGDYDRCIVDPSTTSIVRGIDVRKIELHTVSMASDEFRPHRIVDYTVSSHGHSETTVQQAELLIYQALCKTADEWEENPLRDTDGVARSVDLTLIDKGWVGTWTEDGAIKSWINQPVESFCMKYGLDHWLPAKAAPNYRQPSPSRGVIIGDNWHINRKAGQGRRCDEVIWNAAHWHLLVEELFMTEPGDNDGFELFADGDGVYTNHKAFSEHITVGAKQMKDQMAVGTRSKKPKFVRDHWWDSAAMMLVAKSIVDYRRDRLARRKPARSLHEMTARNGKA